jgi:transcriptional regulator with XRE-family HTH domain
MKTLYEHLTSNKISQSAFAMRLGVDRSIVSRLVNQTIKPGLDLAARIERETDGQVLAVSWVDGGMDVAKSAAPKNEEPAA